MHVTVMKFIQNDLGHVQEGKSNVTGAVVFDKTFPHLNADQIRIEYGTTLKRGFDNKDTGTVSLADPVPVGHNFDVHRFLGILQRFPENGIDHQFYQVLLEL